MLSVWTYFDESEAADEDQPKLSKVLTKAG